MDENTSYLKTNKHNDVTLSLNRFEGFHIFGRQHVYQFLKDGFLNHLSFVNTRSRTLNSNSSFDLLSQLHHNLQIDIRLEISIHYEKHTCNNALQISLINSLTTSSSITVVVWSLARAVVKPFPSSAKTILALQLLRMMQFQFVKQPRFIARASKTNIHN